jgi:hypothetical protein
LGTLKADGAALAGGLASLVPAGQAVGGAGALYLVKYIGFSNTYYFVAAALAVVPGGVALQEPVVARVTAGTGLQRMGAEVGVVRQAGVGRSPSRAHRWLGWRLQSCLPVPWRWAYRCSIRGRGSWLQ